MSSPPPTANPGPAAAEAVRSAVFPERKRRWQGALLMNLLFRPLLGPLVRLLAALGLRADTLTAAGCAAYLAGAWQYVQGSPRGLALGTAAFGAGLLAELLDGSLARLRGPSPLGWFLSQFQARLYVLLLLPSLGIGVFRLLGPDAGLPFLLLGVFGGGADLLLRTELDLMARAHPEEELRARADAGVGRLQRLVLAQFLPDHPSFGLLDRGLRVLRENLLTSSGVQPLALLAAVLAGRPELFILVWGCLDVAALGVAFLARVVLLLRGGGKALG